MAEQEKEGARQGVWRARGVRMATGLNVIVSVVLAVCVLLMVNYLSFRYHTRWDFGWDSYYRLSDRTLKLIESLDGEIKLLVFFRKGDALFSDVRRLVKEYEYAADRNPDLTLGIQFVDPERDVVQTRELAEEYGLTESSVVVFECEGRRKFVRAEDIVDQQIQMVGEGRAVRKIVAFRGEVTFSSAIQNVTQATQPKVYVLTGHGERAIGEYGNTSGGYSRLAGMMTRDNMVVRSLFLAETGGVPDDCSALVVAGAQRRISEAEIAMIAKYLENGGRVMLLLDGAVDVGLDPLAERWGVKIGRNIVCGMTLKDAPGSLVVRHYGRHPITENLRGMGIVLYRPCSVEMNDTARSAPDAPDKPRVTPLAVNGEEDWVDMNTEEMPPRFDKEVDRLGRASVAVAVERGAVKGIEAELKPTKLVVIGDAEFVSNLALTKGMGGNRDFFMCALNWLIEREALMAIAPKPPDELRLDMDRGQVQRAFLILVLGPAGVAAALGVLVWLSRRR